MWERKSVSVGKEFNHIRPYRAQGGWGRGQGHCSHSDVIRNSAMAAAWWMWRPGEGGQLRRQWMDKEEMQTGYEDYLTGSLAVNNWPEHGRWVKSTISQTDVCPHVFYGRELHLERRKEPWFFPWGWRARWGGWHRNTEGGGESSWKEPYLLSERGDGGHSWEVQRRRSTMWWGGAGGETTPGASITQRPASLFGKATENSSGQFPGCESFHSPEAGNSIGTRQRTLTSDWKHRCRFTPIIVWIRAAPTGALMEAARQMWHIGSTRSFAEVIPRNLTGE